MQQKNVSKDQLHKELEAAGISLNSKHEYVRWVMRNGTVVFDRTNEYRQYHFSEWGFYDNDWQSKTVVPALDC